MPSPLGEKAVGTYMSMLSKQSTSRIRANGIKIITTVQRNKRQVM